MNRFVSFVLAAMTVAAIAGAASADTLTIGTRTETTSIFPNWWVTTPNQQVASHMFNNLVEMDEKNHVKPGLAESWRPIDDKVWEFKLRKGVKFHDGTPFTADHVIATFDQAKGIEGSGAPSGLKVRAKTYEKVDDYAFRISAGKPYPLLPNEMSILYIYPKPAPVADFNSGKAAIGTGPYKFVEWLQGDRLVMERNADYWGSKPEWDRVVFKQIKADPSRVAALLNGDVDVIDNVPTTDIAQLKKDPKTAVAQVAGERIIMLQLDSSRDISPFVKGNDGKPLFPNPLRDWRVRKAISKAINRDAVVERVMEGAAVAAGQVATIGMFGFDPDLKPEPYDAEGAKKLLAQAGYPDGFHLTLHGPNDRYVNDAKIIETVAAMLTRVGIKSKVVTMPRATYFSRQKGGGELGAPEFSVTLYGFGTATGETMSQLWMLLHAENPERALGHANMGHYANVGADVVLDKAIVTLDDAEREKLIRQASAIYMRDVALVPLHYQVNTWATRKGLAYRPRLMEVTHAMSVTKVK